MVRTKNIKAWECYEVKGDKVNRKKESCPKCGEGTFLGVHKDRKTCGKCKYTVFIKK